MVVKDLWFDKYHLQRNNFFNAIHILNKIIFKGSFNKIIN
jgi:hypothetical protein